MSGHAKSLKRKAYEALLGRILRRELLPGEIINRRAVAGELGMSTAPVLEAMLQLDSEGFLETLPRKGTRVRIVRPADILGMMVLREALECQGARLCCGGPVRRQASRLERLAKEAEADWKKGVPGQWQSELALHRALMELTDCPALLQMFDQLMSRAFFFQLNQALPPSGGGLTTHHSHLELVRALSVDAPDAAEAAMRKHVNTGKAPLLRS